MSRYGSDAEISGSIEVSGSAIFNEGSLDADFRVESDSNTHMLYVDAGNNKVGIGTDAPDYELDVAGNIGVNQYIYHNGDGNTWINFTDNRIRLNAGGNNFIDCEDPGSAPHKVRINNGGNNIDFVIKDNNNDVYFTADASTGRIGINGVSSPECELHVDGDVKIAASSGDTSLIVQGKQDVTIGLVADTDNTGGEDQNPSIYMSQETTTAGAYQFLMGIEGTADLSYVGSYTNQPFILSKNSEQQGLRTFQIATDDGGDVSSRFSIATGGRIAIGDAVQAADARLHVKEAAGDIFKMENTTAYAVTYGQLVKENLTLTDGGSPLDTTLDLPARSIITDVLITIKTAGVGTSHNLENVALTANSQTNNIKGSSFPSGLSLISNPSQGVAAGTQYVLGNTDQSFPAGRAAMLLPSTADVKLVYSDDGISTEPIVDVVVFYKKYDAS